MELVSDTSSTTEISYVVYKSCLNYMEKGKNQESVELFFLRGLIFNFGEPFGGTKTAGNI